jgi:hypothetical protein
LLSLSLGANLCDHLRADLSTELGLVIGLTGRRQWSVRISRRGGGSRGIGIALLAVSRVLHGRGILRIADLQVVVHLGDALHMADNRLRQIAGGGKCNRSGERDLALNGGRGDQVVF